MILVQSWCSPGVVLGRALRRPLGGTLGVPGVDLELVLERLRGLCWVGPGVVLRQSWCRPGVVRGRALPGVALELILEGAGMVLE